MSVVAFDRIATNTQLLLSLPFREDSGLLTCDVARPGHPPIILAGPPTWASIGSGLGVLQLDGAGDYGYCPAADCVDLDFTTDDYSIAGWINWTDTMVAEIIIGRYGTELDGWEAYMFNSLLSLRHNHVSLTPDVSDSCYSSGWTPGAWWFMGITRSGLYPRMYRNGLPVGVTYDAGGLKDPDTCNRDLVIGTRYTKNTNWYSGSLWNLRVWAGELTPIQMLTLFNMERHWFGV